MSKNTAKVTSVNVSVEQHIEAAEDFLSSAEERLNDVEWAKVEVEIAKTHLMAAVIKTSLSMLGGDRKGAIKAAPAVIGIVSKLAAR